jgi:HK97 family phage prohead protease
MKTQTTIEHKQFSFKAEDISSEGTFTGYGSVFGNIDGGGDVVEKGAFALSLDRLRARDLTLPMLWQHKTDEPIGDWPMLAEDERGLKGQGSLWLDVAPYARIAHRGLMAKAVTGLSIGYRIKEKTYDKKNGITILQELDVKEISLVTFPMNDLARVDAVKAALDGGDLPTIRTFEKFLREAGFSKTQSVAIANHGLLHLYRSESGDSKAKQAARCALATLRFHLR